MIKIILLFKDQMLSTTQSNVKGKSKAVLFIIAKDFFLLQNRDFLKQYKIDKTV